MTFSRAAMSVLFLGLAVDQSQAAFAFVITQNQSQLNLDVSGTAFGGALTVTEQHPTAVTRYNGTISANFPGGPVAGGSIAFPGGGSANAVNPTGTFNLPRQYSPNVGGGSGTAPANYGVNLNAPVGIPIPPIEIPDVITLNLGTLQSVNIAVALRDISLDITSGNPIPIGTGGVFSASGVDISIESGFADLNGALVFQQDNLVDHFAAVLGVNALVLAFPELGLSVSSNFLNRTISLGLGTRVDLAGVGGLTVQNEATTNGTVTYVNPETQAVILLPVLLNLPVESFGLPADILTLNLSLSGQLRATAFVPEPSSISLASMGLLGIGILGYRHRRAGVRKEASHSITV